MSVATLVSVFDRILARLAIDPQAYRGLVKVLLLMDLRNQQYGKSTATSAKARISPVFWVLGQNLIVGLITSFLLFARVDSLFFTFVGLVASAIIVGTAVVVEFHEIVLDPQDLLILGHRPIPARTYAAARVTNLLGYLVICSCSVGLFPAIMGAAVRDVGWGQFPMYICGSLIADFLVAGFVILLFAEFRASPNPQSQELLAWLQVGLIMILFYGGQVILKDGSQPITWTAYQFFHRPWIWYLPHTWLAHAVRLAGFGESIGFAILAVTGLSTLVLWSVVLRRLSRVYEALQPGRPAWAPTTSPPLAAPGELFGKIGKFVTRPGEDRAAFWLTWTMLDRDPNLRMRCWPSFGVVIALAAVGVLTGQLKNPLTAAARDCVMTLGTVYLVAEAIPGLLHQLRFSQHFEASWILVLSPIKSPVNFVFGICKALWCRFILPFASVMFVVYLWAWKDPLSACLHGALIGVTGWGFLAGCALVTIRRIPFSAALARGESFGPIAAPTAATTAIAMAMAFLHSQLVGSHVSLAIYFGAMIVVCIVVHFVVRARLASRFSQGMPA
jgi:hypothetical protein